MTSASTPVATASPKSSQRPGATALAIIALVMVSSLVLLATERATRTDLEASLIDAVRVEAEFTATVVADLGERQAAVGRNSLSGDVTNDDLSAVAATLRVGFALLFNSAGEVIAVHPPREVSGPDLLATFPHLQAAMAGSVGTSATLDAPTLASGVAIAIAAPYDTPTGRRVLSTAFDRGDTRLDPHFATSNLTRNDLLWLVDEAGGVISSNGVSSSPPRLDKLSETGVTYLSDDLVAARGAVDGTPWHIIIAAPQDDLMAPIRGMQRWGIWAVVAVFAALSLWLDHLYRRQRQLQTVLQIANEQLAFREQRAREFVAIASHELKTPATIIAGSVEVLGMGWATTSEDEKTALLDALGRASTRLNRLIGDLMTQALADEGRLPLHIAQADIDDVLDVAIASSRARRENVSITGERGRLAKADDAHLSRVIANLLDNAVKYGAAPIELDVQTTTNDLKISVRDHGAGVPSEFVPQLFERFAQADPTDTRRQSGAGLGLSVVAAVLEQMGGSVTFEDADPGSCFVITLPRA